MRVLFYDTATPGPYTGETLRTKPLGGTEATCIRIAEALASRGHRVTVTTHRSEGSHESFGVTYSRSLPDAVDAVVCLRAHEPLPMLRERYPNAMMVLWLHDIAGKEIALNVDAIVKARAKVVCVSQFHRTQVVEVMKANRSNSVFPVVNYIYNPVDPTLRPDLTQYDPNKIVFFSSPHKGLLETVQIFAHFQRFPLLKDIKLCIANPGYLPDASVRGVPNIVNLGALAHHEIMRHVRESLCVFHMNRVFPETFGLVYAEAQAVGTPFLAHDMGAIREISDHPAQLLDIKDLELIIQRMTTWAAGYRPSVRLDSRFRTNQIAKEWETYLARAN